MGRRVIWILLAGLAVAGCGRRARDDALIRPLEPRMAATGGEFAANAGGVAEEVSPARQIDPVQTVANPAGRAAPVDGALTRPADEATYEARLEEVPLPVPPSRTPMVTRSEEGENLRLVNAVLAEVNDEVITREDILGPLRPQMRQWRQDLAPEEFESNCRAVVDLKLRQIISERLVVQEAKRRLSDFQKEQLDVTLGQMLKGWVAEAGSRLLLEERLKTEGKTVDQKMESERERIVVQQFLRDRIAPTIHVTHSELLDYYHKVRAERYVKGTRVRLGLIVIRKREFPDVEQARALAEAVRNRAVTGEDFAKLAETYSHGAMASKGGDWGYMRKGAFRVRAVDVALFSLQEGEVAPVVETEEAFSIVKATDREEGRTVPFTEVQDELEDDLRDAKYNETVSRYIQELYEKSYIRIHRENL